MNRLIRITTALLIVLAAVVIWSVWMGGNKVTYVWQGEFGRSDVEEAFSVLNSSLEHRPNSYLDLAANLEVNYDLSDEQAILLTGNPDRWSAATLGQHDQAVYNVHVREDGYYHLQLDYAPTSESLIDSTLSIKINGEHPFDEARTLNVPLRWKDATKDFVRDSYGDETLPPQIQLGGWSTIQLYNNQYDTVMPLLFEFKKGNNTILIENVSSNVLMLGDLILKAPREIPSYDEYYSHHETSQGIRQYVNAISYVEKNSSYIRMDSVNNPALEPFHAVDRLLNVIDGGSWSKSGQELVYEVTVPETGNYKLALYYQNSKNDFVVFRTIRIDGKILFKEMMAYPFPATKGKWQLEVLSDDNCQPYEFYLTKGTHQISLAADYEPVAKSVRDIHLLLNHINQFSLEIIKLTGKNIDKNRTWQLTRYIPETDTYLAAYETIIKNIIAELSSYAPNKEASATLSYLQKALYSLDKLRKYPDRLPIYLEDLSTGTASVAQRLGDSIAMLSEQPLSLDGFLVFSDQHIDQPKAALSARLKAGFQSFASSFTSDKYSPKLDPEAVDIWVNRAITYVDLMQKLADAEFTPRTGIRVNLSVMPDANKLILAAAAGEAPDVALGLPSYMPFDFAIRNAVRDLSAFPDFWEIAGSFAPGAFVPYVLNDSVYALPETLDFNAIIYRTDLFNAMGLEVPDTWDEVIKILPELQRYGMSFYHPIAGGGALKWFYQTAPFIYQYNGSLYSEDGLTTTIDSPEAAKGLSFLNSLFTTYSLPEQVASFYNSFRYNQIPIGIVSFGDYLQIKNAAPELIGQVALANNPGTRHADGTINRSFIANGSAGIILADTEKAEESWEFLKWWMSRETQTTFAYHLQSTYGPEFVWLSGNIDAVKNSPIDEQDKRIILDQIEWLVDVPRTPGQYMLERGLSDIWNKAVFDGTPTGVAIDAQVILINRENRRKLVEFGFLDQHGNVVKPYIIRDVDWIRAQMERGN